MQTGFCKWVLIVLRNPRADLEISVAVFDAAEESLQTVKELQELTPMVPIKPRAVQNVQQERVTIDKEAINRPKVIQQVGELWNNHFMQCMDPFRQALL